MLGTKLFRNFAWLGLSNGLSALFPLILYPIIVRQIGFGLFGEYSIILTICLFASVVTDYGFNISAIRKLTTVTDRQNESTLFSLVVAVKIAIFLLLVPVVALAILLTSPHVSFFHVYAGAMAMIAGNMINPTWYFLAKQQMPKTILPNIISKLLAIVLCWLLIKGQEDTYLLYYIIGGTTLLYGVSCFAIPMINRSVHFVRASVSSVGNEFREGFGFFFSNLSISFYTQIVFILLAVFSSKVVVGQYAIADRVVFLLRQIGGVFSQSFFVEMCEMVHRKTAALTSTIKKQFLLFFSGMSLVCVAIFVFSEPVIHLLAGEKTILATTILRIIIWVPVIVTANIPFYQVMLALNRKASYNAILLLGCLFAIVSGVVLCYYYSATGAAIANLATELLITLLLMARASDTLPLGFFTAKAKN